MSKILDSRLRGNDNLGAFSPLRVFFPIGRLQPAEVLQEIGAIGKKLCRMGRSAWYCFFVYVWLFGGGGLPVSAEDIEPLSTAD